MPTLDSYWNQGVSASNPRLGGFFALNKSAPEYVRTKKVRAYSGTTPVYSVSAKNCSTRPRACAAARWLYMPRPQQLKPWSTAG